LCERGRAGFRLTDEGCELHAAAQRLLGAVDTFHMEAGALRNELHGVLRFGMIEATLTDKCSPLPLAIRTFGQSAQDVHLQVQVDTPMSMEQHVLDGRLHLAVGPFPTQLPGLIYTPLYREEQGLYCASTHPLFERAQGPVAPRELHAFKLASRPYLGTQEIELLGMQLAAASVDNVEGRAMLILSGNYIGFLPPHYAQPWVEEGMLRRVDSSRYATHLDFRIITRRGNEQARVLRIFVEHLLRAAEATARAG